MLTQCVEPAKFDNATLGRQNAMSFTIVRQSNTCSAAKIFALTLKSQTGARVSRAGSLSLVVRTLDT